jgi:2-oxoglutarate dehydrogenase E2 component (dihydrolipoamide succinyltransferase)
MASYKLYLPKMGESVAEATVIKWVKQPGDYVHTDEAVMEIATDKVDSDVPSPVSGKLVTQYYKENDVVQVGSLIAVIETDEPEAHVPFHYEPEKIEAPVYTPKFEPEPEPEPFKAEVEPEPVPFVPDPNARKAYIDEDDEDKNDLRFYSPLVRKIAATEGIPIGELMEVPGTGVDGRLTKDDLINYVQIRNKKLGVDSPEIAPEPPKAEPIAETPKAEPVVETSKPEPVEEAPKAEPTKPEPVAEAPKAEPVAEEAPKPEPIAETHEEIETPAAVASSGDEIIEMDRMRRLIAEHMVMSKHVSAHVTSFVEADVTNLVQWRDRIKASFEKREGEKITLTPIFIEAVVRSIRDFPMINVSVNGTQIIKKKDINIGMATALSNGNLIVPVIKRADELNLTGLTKEVNDLAERARSSKLKPDDVQDGTFTITNVGSFGNVMGTPIINQPQVAILAIGVIRKKPAVIETLQGDMIGIRHMMFMSLSYDHRVVDGALGGMFIKRVSDYLENWDTDREI